MCKHLLGIVIVGSALSGPAGAGQELSEPERTRLQHQADELLRQGEELYQRSQPADALPKAQAAYELRLRIYPAAQFPDGHPALVDTLLTMARIHNAAGRPDQALPHCRQALAINEKLYPKSRFPDGSVELAGTHSQVGLMLYVVGRYEESLTSSLQGVQMLVKLFPPQVFPRGNTDLATALNNLGLLLFVMGQHDQALGCSRRAVNMHQFAYPADRFPDGHIDLATGLNSLSVMLKSAGRFDEALPITRQTVDMLDKLYPSSKFPNGQPSLALALNNYSSLLQALGKLEQALAEAQRAAAMVRKLYPVDQFPDGHPDLAVVQNNIGHILQTLGRYEEALPQYRAALAMFQRLYPPIRFPAGHPRLFFCVNNLGGLFYTMGRAEDALPHYGQALAMRQRLLAIELSAAPEAAALQRISTLPLTRDAYLSVSRSVGAPANAAYALVWETKAAVTRVLEQRQLAARVSAQGSGAGDARRIWEELLRTRRVISQTMLQPPHEPRERDRQLGELTLRRDDLERQLAKTIPGMKRTKALAGISPNDLATKLPPGAALVDVLRYTFIEYDAHRPGIEGEKLTPSYVAFIVRAGSAGPIRVELGPAQPIDQAIRQWRQAIEKGRASFAASIVAKLVRDPIVKHLTDDVQTLLIAPDEDLWRLPWGALPGRQPGSVFLEDYALALVPHAQFLLERLAFPMAADEGTDALLAVGDVEFGPGAYASLPGTMRELAALAPLAAGRAVVRLDKAEATAACVLAALPRVRYAHFATHGYFAEKELADERLRTATSTKSKSLLSEPSQPSGAGVKSPLAYTGLVFADANRDRAGIVTGETIVTLPLDNMRLCVLCACETGLGDLTGGEGVQGLQRAFHLAGCPNVVASLWKVNDAATAALMAKFYHEMWVNKKPPIEALREAQLTICRHPELIPDLAGERGAPRLKEAVAVKLGEPSGVSRRVGDTKLWAAFVLSGVGR